jgi:hypothetical protein
MMSHWGGDDLTHFLDVVHSNQIGNFARFPEPYAIMRRVNDCYVRAGNDLVDPRPMMTGPMFHRSQYAYKTAVGMTLAGQVVESFVIGRSCLEYAGYALAIFDNPELEDVFLKRHFDESSKKQQRGKFQIGELTKVISKYDEKLSDIFNEVYQCSIDFGGHPNPHAVLSAFNEVESSNGTRRYETLALNMDEKALKLAMKSTFDVGLAALIIFGYIFRSKFEHLGLSAEIESLAKVRWT